MAGIPKDAAERALARLIARGSRKPDITPEAREVARRMLARHGSLAPILESQSKDLMDAEKLSKSSARLVSMIPQLARYLAAQRLDARLPITGMKQAGEFLRTRYIGVHYERVHLLCLDESGRVIGCPMVQEGTLNETPFYTRNILETVTRLGACAVVLSHNHPAGTAAASLQDIQATQHTLAVIGSVNACLLDHLIVADGQVFSMMQSGAVPAAAFLSQKRKSPLLNTWLD